MNKQIKNATRSWSDLERSTVVERRKEEKSEKENNEPSVQTKLFALHKNELY